MGRRVIDEVVMMRPRLLFLACCVAWGQPYPGPFNILRRRIECTPQVKRHGNA